MGYHNKKFKRSVNCSNLDYGIIMASVLLFVFIIIFSFLYIFQVNSLVNYSYKIREAKKELSQLKEQSDDFKSRIAETSSPSELERKVEKLGMVKSDSPVYLEKRTEMAVKN